ncbi:MAG: hypothetical protein AM1032_000009 [Mycoplasmataceae bacterium]|nr:MAG: hypothetical protein AM1032_000009 [Mycoplasmataceae bacterium]
MPKTSDHWKNNYFDSYWLPLFIENNKIDIKKSYYPILYKQLRKCINKLLEYNPEILDKEHFYYTFKRPHTSSLKKWRKTLRDYLRKFFTDNPHLNKHKLLFFREFHKCRLDCHYLVKYNELNEKSVTHSKKACSCNDNGKYYNHECKHDIHKMLFSSMDLDFSTWSHGYDIQIVDPNELCKTESKYVEDLSLRHPITREIVDEMTKVICYANKEAEGRFINPKLYRSHDDNPNNEYFDIFNYQADLSYRNWKKTYNEHYSKEKKELIKKCLSRNPIYHSWYRKIKYLDNKINKVSNEEKKIIRKRRTKLIFEFIPIKEKIIKGILSGENS